jgi:hypothetical protein
MRDQTGTLVDTDTLLAISPAHDTTTDRLRRAAATRKVSLFVAVALITGLVPAAIALIVAGVETHLEHQVISNSAFDLLITCMALGFIGALIGFARDSVLRYMRILHHDQSRVFEKLDIQTLRLDQMQEALTQLPHAVEEYGDERAADARVQAIRDAVHVPYQAGGGRPQLLRQQG